MQIHVFVPQTKVKYGNVILYVLFFVLIVMIIADTLKVKYSNIFLPRGVGHNCQIKISKRFKHLSLSKSNIRYV